MRKPPTYHRRNADPPSQAQPYRLRVVWQKSVHPSSLDVKCTGHRVRCEYATRLGKRRIKCGWFGFEACVPYERPRCCRFATTPIPPLEAAES